MAAVVALEEEGVGGWKQQGGRGEQHQCQEINEVAEETEVPVCWTASELHLWRRVAVSASRLFIHSFNYFYLLQNSRGAQYKIYHRQDFFLNCPNKINKIHHNKIL